MAIPGLRWRLFLTCWVLYTLHFATDFAREHYLVMSIVDDHSFALDKYYGLHVDIFQNPPEAPVQGAHHGANPGISMIAAVPYALLKPAVDMVVARSLQTRAGHPDSAVTYQDDRWRRVEFYKKVRAMGLDIRFGLIAAITLAFCMAPLTALSVVLIERILEERGMSQRTALAGSLLYGLGTPVFFRAAYLNQNLAIAVFALGAFYLLWDPALRLFARARTRYLLAGLLGGICLLNDYSGGVVLAGLGLYGLIRGRDDASWGEAFRLSLWFTVGAIPAVLLLWFYQWASFGNPFLPPQNWMAPVEWIDVGYKGVGGFTPELFRMLLIDSRFGLFITAPMMMLALAAPWVCRPRDGWLPRREAMFCLLSSLAMVVFFSCVQYTRLQWVTGIRYLAPVFPFMFLAAFAVLLRLPRALIAGIAVLSFTISWCMAMVRSQGTVFENLQRAFTEGLQLPWLTVLGKTATQYLPGLHGGVSALPLLLLAGAVIYLIWTVRSPWERPDPAAG